MAENALSALALACSIAALACSLVVMIRSTPARVRKAAYAAAEIAEETQNGFRNIANQMASFQGEITRERQAAADDLVEAERKRRQAAAKLSKVANATPSDAESQPTTLSEAMAKYDQGDPRRMVLLRRFKNAGGG